MSCQHGLDVIKEEATYNRWCKIYPKVWELIGIFIEPGDPNPRGNVSA